MRRNFFDSTGFNELEAIRRDTTTGIRSARNEMVRLRVLNDDRRRYGHYGHYGPAKWVSLLGLLLCWAISASGAAAQQPDFIQFESPPTRPLALSLDGSKLFVANTPDGKLEIFSVVTKTN